VNERERLVAVLEGGTPDRTPWYGDLSWWHTAHCEAGDLPDEYARGDRGYLKMHADAGVGIYLYAPMLWTQAYDASVTETVTVAGTATISTLSTPVGRVRSVTAGLPGSATSAIVEHYVKVPDDLHVMQYAWTHRTVAPNYAAFRSCDDLWGDQGMACALAPIATTALQTLMTRWAGVETTVRLWAYAREDLERTIGVVQEADDAVFDLICAGPGVNSAGTISSPVLTIATRGRIWTSTPITPSAASSATSAPVNSVPAGRASALCAMSSPTC